MKIAKAIALSGALTVGMGATSAEALNIQLFNTGGVEVGTNAYYGFSQAASFWQTMITNDVTVNLNVGFGPLGAGILGSTGSTTNVAYVGNVLPALQASGNSALDAIAAANLPTTRPSGFVGGQAIDALISAPKANGNGVLTPLSRILDADASGNNSAFSANTSLMKALGLAPTYAANNLNQADGSVTFSSSFAFDFDPTNGIDADKFDFIGVAIHEIGHALGFRSGVDVYDSNANFNGNLNNFAIMSIWDVFRYSQQSAALGVNDWAVGGAGASAPYFSIDGGATIYSGDAYFSTGRNLGDGRQASHWKDVEPSLGLLDPTVGRGIQTYITSLDIAAYDAMGWNVAFDVMAQPNKRISTAQVGNLSAYVPEPATWALMVGGFFLLGGAVRGRRARAVLARA